MLLHDLGDGASSDTMIQVSECSLDTGVAPSRVVLGDEPAMPGKYRIGRHNGGDGFQSPSSKRFALGGQSANVASRSCNWIVGLIPALYQVRCKWPFWSTFEFSDTTRSQPPPFGESRAQRGVLQDQ